MLGIFMPKIYRERRRAKRHLARQHRQHQYKKMAAEEWRRSGGTEGEWEGREGVQGGSSTLHSPSWYSGGLSDDEECPAFDPTCPISPPPHHDLQHSQAPQRSQFGPMPGMRPPMGGAGGILPPPQSKESGAMWIIMPIYTVGIAVFFFYTIMRMLFKKAQNEDKMPKLKDFGLDPEYRKYVLAEEYMEDADASTRDHIRRQQREDARSRRRPHQDEADIKLGGGRGGKMDTKGKKLGEWYLPEGFMNESGNESDDSDIDYTIGGTTVTESALETLRERLMDGLRQGSNKSSIGMCMSGNRSGFPRQNTLDEDNCKEYMQQMREEATTKRDTESTEDLRREVLEGSSTDDMIRGGQDNVKDMSPLLDYMYSDEVLENLKNGLKRCNTLNTFDADSFEDVFSVIRDYIVNKRYNDTPESIYPDEQNDVPEDTGANEPETPKEHMFTDSCDAVDASDQALRPHSLFSSVSDKSHNQGAPPSDIDEVYCADPAGETDSTTLAEAEALVQQPLPECSKKDEQLVHLRRRLEETERAMERLTCQMGSVTDKVTAAKITEVLSQVQAQARILKEKEETLAMSKGSSPDMDEYEVITKEEEATPTLATQSKPQPSHFSAPKIEGTKSKSQEAEENGGEEELSSEDLQVRVRKRNIRKPVQVEGEKEEE